MLPLTFVTPGEKNSIKKIMGKDDTRQFLETLGFVPGSLVVVVSKLNGNVIVNIREARIAISSEMAGKIMV